MRASDRISLVALALAGLLGITSRAGAVDVGTVFTYQGSLNDNGALANGNYDFRFTLFDAASGGDSLGVNTLDDVQVAAGIFTVDLDFGAVYSGAARWLLVEIRLGSSTGAYTVLPRQRLNPTPYAAGVRLPLYEQAGSSGTLFSLLNTGTGNGASFIAGNPATLNYGVIGGTSSTVSQAAGVRGVASGTSGLTIGVQGIATASLSGTGLVGTGSATGAYIAAIGAGSTGVYAFGKGRGLYAQNDSIGPAIVSQGPGADTANAVVVARNVGNGPAIYGISTSTDTSDAGMVARNTGAGIAVLAIGNGSGRDRATLRLKNTNGNGECQFAVNNSTQSTAHFQNNGSGQVLWLEKDNPGNFIQAWGNGENKFWVDQAGTTHTKVLEILGGADLSERFDVREESAIEPGMVVSIDDQHEGRLAMSREPYDHRVAGIISGAGGVKPGMLMGQRGSRADGAHPVALTGRVYCRATAANGPIRPGDLLTTSALPGHAMRVDDAARSQGAILGKAMGSLESGEGLILVLVGLQ